LRPRVSHLPASSARPTAPSPSSAPNPARSPFVIGHFKTDADARRHVADLKKLGSLNWD
jgi:hypothetical protein